MPTFMITLLGRSAWQPNIVTVRNNSCSASVEVEFLLAPPSYQFSSYTVAVRRSPKRDGPDISKQIVDGSPSVGIISPF